MLKPSNFTNIKEFIEYIKNKDNIDDILNQYETQSEKGFVYERLWDLIIKFGFCPFFPNSEYEHINCNINTGKPKKLGNLQNYLLNNKVQSGNSGGCSDITLFNLKEQKYIFISSKYPKCDEDNENIKNKPVDYYDIQNILAVIKDNENIYQNCEIYLLVPNKNNVFETIKKSSKMSSYITKHMKNILDKNDLQNYYKNFLESIKKHNFDEYNLIYGKKRDNLKLFFHQELIIRKTAIKIEEGQKDFLWGCKCRSGKTFMCGGIILNHQKVKNIINVLIITPAPTETAPQFTEDLFNNFIDFNNYNIHFIKDGNYLKNLNKNNEKSNIYVASKQLLQNYINENKSKKLNNLDLIIFDESHFTGTTYRTKEILNSYSSKNTVKIFLTATYNKPLKEWKIKEDCQFYWNIEDEQICKLICSEDTKIKQKEVDRLLEKHGELVKTIIEEKRKSGIKTKDIFSSYLKMPELCLITSIFDKQRYDDIKNKLDETVYGFSFDGLFSMNKQKTLFKYSDHVKTFLRYISGSDIKKDYSKGDKSIFTRIFNICSTHETRKPFTQIWFLPPNNINETSKALIKIMKEDKILKEFDIYSINSKNETLQNDIKAEITKMESEALNTNKKGLILLAGNMLGLGITLKNCDIVMLLNNSLSCDKVMQQMFRCMTEGENKKYGFVVDLNIGRVLNTCVNYSVYDKNENLEEKIRYLIKYHLINIDVDCFDNKKINSDILIDKILKLWKDDPINNLRTLLRNLDNEYLVFDNETQKLLNKSFTSSTKGDIKATIEIKDENDDLQSIKSGKETMTENEKEKTELEKELEEIEKAEKEISFTKDVLPYVIPLTCILTMNNTNKDFLNMLKIIKSNPELLEIFDEQSLIWWNKKDLIDIISKITEKYINKNSNTFNISLNFKIGMQSLIDKPKELLELINECLKPKEIEKKKFGEVFTPMTLVNEMLDKLPKEVWKNKNLKWLDPCVGMGNFPIAVYLRLMESLKEEITDEKNRKKHILENMLYMCELNKKNCHIVKQIFNINNEYKLNLHEGDFLIFDSKKTFNIDKFDVIVGNPPYQNANASGDNKLYLEFTKKTLNILVEKGFLLFITPRNILEYLLLVEKNRKYIDNFYQLKYIAIETSNKYFPNVGSTFAYFLLEKNIYYEKTTIEFMNNNKLEITKIMLEIGFKIPRIITENDIKILSELTSKTNNYILYDFMFNNKTQRIRKEHIKKNIVSIKETEKNNIKIIDTINKTSPFPGKYYYYSLKDNDYDKNKLILSKKGYLMPFIDNTKSYTYSDNFKYIIDDDIKQIKILLDSKLVKYLLIQYSKNGFDAINIVKIINKKNLKNVKNEKDLYKIYNLTEEHIKHIDNVLGIATK
jgi:hypothetical protein